VDAPAAAQVYGGRAQVPQAVDLLITGGQIVTMDAGRRIVDNGAIAIAGNRILAVGPTTELASNVQANRTLDARGRTIFPGLINTHTHLFQTLLKGPGDDRQLEDWFCTAVGPAATQLTEEDCYLAALAGCIEAIRSGTTTIKDFMYVHPVPQLSDAVIRAFAETGIRGVYVRGYVDTGEAYGIPRPLIQEQEAILADCERVIRRYHGSADGRITVRLGPCMIWSCTREGLEATRSLATALDVGLTMHVAETPFSIENSMQRFGVADLAFLERIGFLGPDVLAVHGVYLTERDLRILKARDVKVSHNPTSNMYLASGVAPIPQMLLAGITVGLATDGPASNNNQNMIEALKFGALLHKVHTKDPTAITAERILEMATIEGARALGLDDVGSLEPGKKADLIIVNLQKPHASPVHHPVSSLVYSASGEEVEMVIIDGKVVMEDRRIVTVDEENILARAQTAADRLMARAGLLPLRQRWRRLAY